MTNENSNLDQFFAQLEAEARQAAAGLGSPEAIENFRLDWLGRKNGRLKQLSDQWLKSAAAEQKREIGQRFNALKTLVDGLLEAGLMEIELYRAAFDFRAVPIKPRQEPLQIAIEFRPRAGVLQLVEDQA